MQTSRDVANDAYDIGLFKVEHDGLPNGLLVSERLLNLEIGEVIGSAGFPTAIDTIAMPPSPATEIHPTYRFGRIERTFGELKSEYGKYTLIQHDLPSVGGCSGAPLLDKKGELIGIVTSSSFRFIYAKELSKGGLVFGEGPVRLLDAANVNFATNAIHLRDWLKERGKKGAE